VTTGKIKVRWVDNIKIDIGEIGWEGVLTGLVWLKIGVSGFCKMLGISLVAAHEIGRIVKIVTFKLFEVSM
jgi:hypothetical protein